MGIFEGKNYTEALTALVASGKRLLEFEVPEGESLDELGTRAESFFRVNSIENNIKCNPYPNNPEEDLFPFPIANSKYELPNTYMYRA